MKQTCLLSLTLFALGANHALARSQPDTKPSHRAAYSKNLRIHVGQLGVSDGKPLTKGDDFKPVWSKTGDKILFFNRVVNHREVGKWKTAVYIINVDGSGLQQLTSGKFTDFNHTWTRDGKNATIWNRKKPKGGGYTVMAGRIGGKPGEEYALTDPSHHAWAYTTLKDGRIFVGASPHGQGPGYYLMTPNPKGKPTYERVNCALAKTGTFDRVSLSPDEKKICFEYTKGFKRRVPGRPLYLGNFNASKLTITKTKAFANQEGRPVWFAYPRWTRDQSAIMYHAGGKLYLYKLTDGSTTKVSIDDKANYIYPHGEATPK